MIDKQDQGAPKINKSQDIYIQNTSNDAALSRLSAINKHYIPDEYTRYFVRKPARLSPIMNRGTYCRFTGIQSTITKFLLQSASYSFNSPTVRPQVVSLGAGFDTTYFLNTGRYPTAKFFEIDFPSITKTKIGVIKSNSKLADFFGHELNQSSSDEEINTRDYCLISGDLREFDTEIVNKLLKCGFDTSMPTLVIAECVLVYLEVYYSERIVSWFDKEVTSVGFICYEQINPHDRFGQQMISNLMSRGVFLAGISALPTLQSQENRFSSKGWDYSKSVDLWQFHKCIVQKEEMLRVTKLEFLDELEELALLLQHYCFTVAYKSTVPEYSRLFSSIKLDS